MEFKKMSLKELWQFWLKDWEQDAPKLEDTNTMREWEIVTDKAIDKATLYELIEALHISEKEFYYHDQLMNMRKAVFKYICEELEDRVDTIEKSVRLLLKEHEDQAANITIGQLNRLKGGV